MAIHGDYSLAMTKLTAPDFSPGYPSKGERLGPAWAKVWAILEYSGEHGRTKQSLAAEVMRDESIKIAESTLIPLIGRAARLGLLTVETRKEPGARGWMRPRSYFRIAPGVTAETQIWVRD